MPINSMKYVIAPVLFSTSFLLCLPALAQQLNRTGGNQSGTNCHCLKAVKEGATTSWERTEALVESLRETQAIDVNACGRSGGVFVNGDTCLPVAALRGPKGPLGEQGPRGRDGQIDWLSLSSGGGDGGGGFGVDVDGDGIGDFASFSEASAAGFNSGVTVDNCSGCGGGGPSGSGSSGSGGGLGAAIGGFFGAIADALGFGGGGGGGGGGAKVICGELYRQGYIPRAVYAADLRYHQVHSRPEALRAYHAWAVPYVRLMRRYKLATWLIRPIGIMWAYQMAYEMGAVDKAPRFGKPVTRVLTSFHEMLGAAFFKDARTVSNSPYVSRHAPTLGALGLLPESFFAVGGGAVS